jgi:hypothetical protein
MDFERIKYFLQSYLDTVVTPRINEKYSQNLSEEINLFVHEIVKGSYQPPIIHVFLDSEPEIRKTTASKPWVIMMMGQVDKDITGFFKVFSINFKVKVHWNKRPIFKNDSLYTED